MIFTTVMTYGGSIGLALIALLAGWVKCIKDQVNKNSIVYRIPYLGPQISKIEPIGWLICFLIIIMTSMTFISSELQRKEMDEQISNLKNISEQIHIKTIGIGDRIKSSVDNLEVIEDELSASSYSIQKLSELSKNIMEVSLILDTLSYHENVVKHGFDMLNSVDIVMPNRLGGRRRIRGVIDQVTYDLLMSACVLLKINEDNEQLYKIQKSIESRYERFATYDNQTEKHRRELIGIDHRNKEAMRLWREKEPTSGRFTSVEAMKSLYFEYCNEVLEQIYVLKAYVYKEYKAGGFKVLVKMYEKIRSTNYDEIGSETKKFIDGFNWEKTN